MAVPQLLGLSQPISLGAVDDPIFSDFRRGDILVGYWPHAPSWPDDWTVLQPGLAWKRYEGIQLDHIPYVVFLRGVVDVSNEDPTLNGSTWAVTQ